MKKNIVLLIAISIIVIASIVIAGMVIYSATRPEKSGTPAAVVTPAFVKPELPGQPAEGVAAPGAPAMPVTKPEGKVIALPMPMAEETVSTPQDEQAKDISGTTPEEATIMGLPVLPPGPTDKPGAQLPVFIPTTNTTGPVPVTPATPAAPSADNTAENPQAEPQNITSFVPQADSTGSTGPVMKEGAKDNKKLPPFTPSTSPTGPVKSGEDKK